MNVNQKTEKLLIILSDLVAFPTESRQTEVSEECLKYAAEFLQRRGLQVELHNSNGFPSLVATAQKTKKPKVMLQAHIDVVPAVGAMYTVKQKHGRLYGRGIYDMKFAAACYLRLVDELQRGLGQYDFGIMLTSDEELGGRDGVGYLLEQGYSAGVCVLPDGGNDWQIETGNKGVWMIRLTAQGKAAHGSRPWEGENAIDKLVACIGDIRATFRDMKPENCSLTLSQISGGQAVNQVPDQASATLDMRFINQEHYLKKCKKVEALVARAGLELRHLAQEKPGQIDITAPPVAEFIRVAEAIRGEPLERTRSMGSSDARYFTAQGIPAVVIRPEGGGAHGSGEWISQAGLEQFYEVLKAYIQQSAAV